MLDCFNHVENATPALYLFTHQTQWKITLAVVIWYSWYTVGYMLYMSGGKGTQHQSMLLLKKDDNNCKTQHSPMMLFSVVITTQHLLRVLLCKWDRIPQNYNDKLCTPCTVQSLLMVQQTSIIIWMYVLIKPHKYYIGATTDRDLASLVNTRNYTTQKWKSLNAGCFHASHRILYVTITVVLLI